MRKQPEKVLLQTATVPIQGSDSSFSVSALVFVVVPVKGLL